MADPKTLHLLTTILDEVRGARADIAAFEKHGNAPGPQPSSVPDR